MNDPTLLQRAARYVAVESGLPQSTSGPTPISESRYIAAMRRVQGRVERRLLEIEVTREEDHQQQRSSKEKRTSSSNSFQPKSKSLSAPSSEKAPFITKF